MSQRHVVTYAVGLLIAICPSVGAQVGPFPGVHLQGVLTDLSGVPVDGPVVLTVRIYSASTGGSPLYEEQFATLASSGLLNLQIGAGLGTTSDDLLSALAPADSTYERYLTMQIEGESEELLPRRRIGGSPYAAYSIDAAALGGQPAADYVTSTALGQQLTGYARLDGGSTFQPSSPDATPLVVQAAAGQTANLQEWRDASGFVLAAVTPAGGVIAPAFSGDGSGLTGLDASQLTTGTVAPARGGLGMDASAAAEGTLLYANSTGTWAPLSPGSGGQVLKMSGAVPTWGTDETAGGGGTVTQVATGLGLTGGPITSSGTISIDPTVVPQLANANSFTGTQTILTGSAGSVGSVVQGSANQAANLQEWRDDIATIVASIDPTGTIRASGLEITGQKNAVVPTTQGLTRVYSQESAENWFEDFGEGQLDDGRAHIDLDPLFLETVSISEAHPVKVFVQPHDEFTCYIRRGTSSFEVIQIGGRSRNGHFTYRIVAKRRGYENDRLEPVRPS